MLENKSKESSKEGCAVEEGNVQAVCSKMSLGRKKLQSNGRKVRSMHDIQDRFLSIKEKKKRDKAIKKQRGKDLGEQENVVVNASLSDSDISNRKRAILKQATKAWEVGKMLGLSIKGDERKVVEELIRLEGIDVAI